MGAIGRLLGQPADLARTDPGSGIGHDVAADAVFRAPRAVCRRPASLRSGPPTRKTSAERAGDINSIAQFTSAFFATFGVMQLLAVLLIGPALAAGTIAQERERRTMEYLYATPLSNLEIVIGKLGGRVLQILYFVLSGRARAGPGHAPGRHRAAGHRVADGHHPEHGPLRDDGFHGRVGLDRQGPRRGRPGVPRLLLPLGAALPALALLLSVRPTPGCRPSWSNSSSPTRS